MTLDEKVHEMSGNMGVLGLPVMLVRYNYRTFDAGGSRRLGIPPLRFTDGPHGVALGNSTCFPVAAARGATFDTDLEERVGEAMGIEARVQGANLFGGVCINVLRHPGWGRAQETYGEDPHHLGAMGVAAVTGLQRHVMACIKHFACNSIEESRFKVDVRVDERTLREVYLPHFKRCVDAGAAAVMSAYNRVNGPYCGHSRNLLREILKDEWGFKGFVVSDFVFGLYYGKAGVEAGLDVEMPLTRCYGRKLRRLVQSGEASEDLIDDAVGRILRQKDRFAGIGQTAGKADLKPACPEHGALAREAAGKAIVLLKNESDTLPLSRERIKKIAVLGPLADKPNIGDKGSSQVRPPYVVTPLEGIRKAATGAIEVVYDDGGNPARAADLAREADVAIIVVGLTAKEEGEYFPFPPMGGDRTNLDLPAAHEDLIRRVAEASDRCVVILEGGSAITMGAWKDRVPAILMAWYPGMEGGHAIAEILFGNINPSGKLPMTFPKTTEQLVDFDKRAAQVTYGYHHGYRHFDVEKLEPEFPFGFGLSYTRYGYDNLRLDEDRVGPQDRIRAGVEVTNTGTVAGEEVVQLYVGCRGSEVERPVKELKGFTRVALEPGETKTVGLEIDVTDLAFYDVGAKTWRVETTDYTVLVGGSSCTRDLLDASFAVSQD